MKKNIIFLALSLSLASALLTGCSTTKTVTDEQRNYISWVAFCANHGYNIHDTSYTTYNEYLDAWCGSVEEEKAFINAGVEPY